MAVHLSNREDLAKRANRLYEQGKNQYEIARLLRTSQPAISKLLREGHAKGLFEFRPRLYGAGEVEHHSVLRAAKTATSCKALLAQFNISTQTLRNILRNAGQSDHYQQLLAFDAQAAREARMQQVRKEAYDIYCEIAAEIGRKPNVVLIKQQYKFLYQRMCRHFGGYKGFCEYYGIAREPGRARPTSRRNMRKPIGNYTKAFARDEVIALAKEALSLRDLARRMNASAATVRRVLEHYKLDTWFRSLVKTEPGNPRRRAAN